MTATREVIEVRPEIIERVTPSGQTATVRASISARLENSVATPT